MDPRRLATFRDDAGTRLLIAPPGLHDPNDLERLSEWEVRRILDASATSVWSAVQDLLAIAEPDDAGEERRRALVVLFVEPARLGIWRERRHVHPVVAGLPVQAATPLATLVLRAPTSSWIEIVVLDDAGVPVVDAQCTIELADGRALSVATDDAGLVRLDPIVAGACAVRVVAPSASGGHAP